MAMLGFPLYFSIILCLTVEVYSDLTIISAIAELKDRMDDLAEKTSVIERQLNESIDSINLRIDKLGHLSNAYTEEGEVIETHARVIKWLISEKGFVRKSLSVYEGRFKDFQKEMDKQITVLNSTIEGKHDKLERKLVANLNSTWNKLQENNLRICPIPFDTDERLSVYEWWSSSRVDLSEGDTIRNQEYVMFNCSNVIEQKYEPANRRFQCVRGQWMEADRNPNWKLGNNGAFPECRESICDPPCENGGVCFKDGLCKCPQMITGDRCQTVLCHESCTRNGGECTKPGTCGNCPKARRGENCELKKICLLPRNAATYENHRTVFDADESIFRSLMKCAQGHTLSSVEVMTCQDNGTWTAIIRCHKTDFSYVVRMQVADRMNAGTDDNIKVRIYGHGEHTAVFRMNGVFGRNQIVENEFRGIDVRPIQTVVVSKDSGLAGDNQLSFLYVSIFIVDSDDYYVFTYRDQPDVWLSASQPLELSILQHPERCIHTYGKAMTRSLKIGGTHIGVMALRECKQRCVTTRSLSCNSIYFNPVMRVFGSCYHSTHSPDSNYHFRNNYISETRRQYASYKRICRES